MSDRLAVVTGASSGIGFELARCCAEDGYDADRLRRRARDRGRRRRAARRPARRWRRCRPTSPPETGVERLVAAIGERPVDVLLANAGHRARRRLPRPGLRGRRCDVVDINVTGTICADPQGRARGCASAGRGRILITGSIAGFMPGSFQAVYNGTKAFLDSF